MERTLQNARPRRMLYLLDIKCLPDESINENVEYNQSEGTYLGNGNFFFYFSFSLVNKEHRQSRKHLQY